MNESDNTLLKLWQNNRNAEAFQEIVARHSNMVYGTCQRILRNTADAEEVTQDCFLALAQAEITKIRILGGWLHSLATSRSLDFIRSSSRRRKREEIFMEAQSEHQDPTWDDLQQFVDAAIETLSPEMRDAVIAHFLEGRSQADIAESEGLTRSALSRRISRAVQKIREHLDEKGINVSAVVLSGWLLQAQAQTIPAAVSASLGRLALSGATTVTQGAGAAATLTISGALVVKIISGILVVAGLLALAVRNQQSQSNSSDSTMSNRIGSGAISDPSIVSPNSALSTDDDSVNTDDGLAEEMDPAAILSGQVVFASTGEPAGSMWVALQKLVSDDTSGIMREYFTHTTVTDEQGQYLFEGVTEEEGYVVAFDDRYAAYPRGKKQSSGKKRWALGEEMPLLEVPPLNGIIKGRVYNQDTGKSVSDLNLVAVSTENGDYFTQTDAQGNYIFLGLGSGEYGIKLERENKVSTPPGAVFLHSVYTNPNVPLELDVPLDMGVPISGIVVDENGERVPNALIALSGPSLDSKTKIHGYSYTNQNGEFTSWGGHYGYRMILSANKDELEAYPIAVDLKEGTPSNDIVIVLHKLVKVSGRFVDSNNRSIDAVLVRKDSLGIWRRVNKDYAPTYKDTFEEYLPPGEYGLMGMTAVSGLQDDIFIPLTLDKHAVENLRIEIPSVTAMSGKYALRGVVTDDLKRPLPNTLVRISNVNVQDTHFGAEMKTDDEGKFSFEGLAHEHYKVYVLPTKAYKPYFHELPVTPGEPLSLQLNRFPSVNGLVLDAETEEPIKHFKLQEGWMLRNGEVQYGEIKDIDSANGEFIEYLTLSDNPYFRVWADGYRPELIQQLSLGVGEELKYTFNLEISPELRGRVVNALGEAVPDATVYFDKKVFNDTINEKMAASRTNAQGEFSLRSLSKDTETIYVWKSGYSIEEKSINDNLNIVLQEGGDFTGKINLGGDLSPTRYQISLKDKTNARFNRWAVSEDGHFNLSGLMAGNYTIVVHLTTEPSNRQFYELVNYLQFPQDDVDEQDIHIPVGTNVVECLVTRNGAPVRIASFRGAVDGVYVLPTLLENGRYRFVNLPSGTLRLLQRDAESDSIEEDQYIIMDIVNMGKNQSQYLEIELSN